MSARILVVEHQASCPPHLVGRWLEEAGCTPSVCRPYADHTVYFTDIVHVSPAGAERFYDAFRDDIEWALAGENGHKE